MEEFYRKHKFRPNKSFKLWQIWHPQGHSWLPIGTVRINYRPTHWAKTRFYASSASSSEHILNWLSILGWNAGRGWKSERQVEKVSGSKINLWVSASLINIALFSAKMENDFLCMVLIIWLILQIICLLNVGRNWLKMILPATDGKTFFSCLF